MSYAFTADEVFEMALQLERNGAKFYRDAANAVANRAKRKLLQELAAMEDEHGDTFTAMRAGLQDKEKEPITFDPDGETERYLRALADTRVFFKKKVNLKSLEEIFKAAIEAEKDSIVFYLGMKDIVPPAAGKSRVDRIIEEEMGHLRSLSTELLKLGKRK
jgi:rubrerythrin